MNGWQRLATVIAAPFCALGFVVGYEDSSIYERHNLPSDLAFMTMSDDREPFWDAYWQRPEWRQVGGIDQCADGTVEGRLGMVGYDVPHVNLSCERLTSRRIWTGLQFAAIPAAFMYILCLAIGWIVAGFRAGRK